MNIKISILGALCAIVLTGCNNIGNAPTPMSPEQTRAALDQATPEQQIDWINRSPMPPEEKARRIKEIEEKYGVKASAVSGASGAPVPQGGK
jgi:hypothetical protein